MDPQEQNQEQEVIEIALKKPTEKKKRIKKEKESKWLNIYTNGSRYSKANQFINDQRQMELMIRNQDYNYYQNQKLIKHFNSIQLPEQLKIFFMRELKQTVPIVKEILPQHKFLLFGEIPLDLDFFINKMKIKKLDSSENILDKFRAIQRNLRYKNRIEFDLDSQYQGLTDFQYIIEALRSMSNNRAFQFSQSLQNYQNQVRHILARNEYYKQYLKGQNIEINLNERIKQSIERANQILDSLDPENEIFIYNIISKQFSGLVTLKKGFSKGLIKNLDVTDEEFIRSVQENKVFNTLVDEVNHTNIIYSQTKMEENPYLRLRPLEVIKSIHPDIHDHHSHQFQNILRNLVKQAIKQQDIIEQFLQTPNDEMIDDETIDYIPNPLPSFNQYQKFIKNINLHPQRFKFPPHKQIELFQNITQVLTKKQIPSKLNFQQNLEKIGFSSSNLSQSQTNRVVEISNISNSQQSYSNNYRHSIINQEYMKEKNFQNKIIINQNSQILDSQDKNSKKEKRTGIDSIQKEQLNEFDQSCIQFNMNQSESADSFNYNLFAKENIISDDKLSIIKEYNQNQIRSQNIQQINNLSTTGTNSNLFQQYNVCQDTLKKSLLSDLNDKQDFEQEEEGVSSYLFYDQQSFFRNFDDNKSIQIDQDENRSIQNHQYDNRSIQLDSSENKNNSIYFNFQNNIQTEKNDNINNYTNKIQMDQQQNGIHDEENNLAYSIHLVNNDQIQNQQNEMQIEYDKYQNNQSKSLSFEDISNRSDEYSCSSSRSPQPELQSKNLNHNKNRRQREQNSKILESQSNSPSHSNTHSASQGKKGEHKENKIKDFYEQLLQYIGNDEEEDGLFPFPHINSTFKEDIIREYEQIRSILEDGKFMSGREFNQFIEDISKQPRIKKKQYLKHLMKIPDDIDYEKKERRKKEEKEKRRKAQKMMNQQQFINNEITNTNSEFINQQSHPIQQSSFNNTLSQSQGIENLQNSNFSKVCKDIQQQKILNMNNQGFENHQSLSQSNFETNPRLNYHQNHLLHHPSQTNQNYQIFDEQKQQNFNNQNNSQNINTQSNNIQSPMISFNFSQNIHSSNNQFQQKQNLIQNIQLSNHKQSSHSLQLEDLIKLYFQTESITDQSELLNQIQNTLQDSISKGEINQNIEQLLQLDNNIEKATEVINNIIDDSNSFKQFEDQKNLQNKNSSGDDHCHHQENPHKRQDSVIKKIYELNSNLSLDSEIQINDYLEVFYIGKTKLWKNFSKDFILNNSLRDVEDEIKKLKQNELIQKYYPNHVNSLSPNLDPQANQQKNRQQNSIDSNSPSFSPEHSHSSEQNNIRGNRLMIESSSKKVNQELIQKIINQFKMGPPHPFKILLLLKKTIQKIVKHIPRPYLTQTFLKNTLKMFVYLIQGDIKNFIKCKERIPLEVIENLEKKVFKQICQIPMI